jgi:hypothetical protein
VALVPVRGRAPSVYVRNNWFGGVVVGVRGGEATARHAGAGHRDERQQVVGQPSARVAQRRQVVVVEGAGLQPFGGRPPVQSARNRSDQVRLADPALSARQQAATLAVQVITIFTPSWKMITVLT